MNEFQQQILQKIEQIALKLENYKTNKIINYVCPTFMPEGKQHLAI